MKSLFLLFFFFLIDAIKENRLPWADYTCLIPRLTGVRKEVEFHFCLILHLGCLVGDSSFPKSSF